MNATNRNKISWTIRACIVIAALLTGLLYLTETTFSWRLLAGLWLVGIGLNSGLWTVLVWWVKRVRRQLPAIKQTRWRVLATFGGYLFFLSLEHLLLNKLIEVSGLVPVPTDALFYLKQSLIDLLWIVVLGAAFEVLYFLKKYKDTVKEAEAARKKQLQNQYDRLKNQVNPHFLFNSLNSLSLLIEDNPQQASEFLDELSSVYRYLLQNNDHQLTSLRAELKFIQAYFYLLKTRFGAAVDLQVSVDAEALAAQLPPLSLHLLIENALNHNIALPEKPLQIAISAPTGGYVDVLNSIQRKSRLVAPAVGLSDITARFGQLNLPPPTLYDDGVVFTVRLPLGDKAPATVPAEPASGVVTSQPNAVRP